MMNSIECCVINRLATGWPLGRYQQVSNKLIILANSRLELCSSGLYSSLLDCCPRLAPMAEAMAMKATYTSNVPPQLASY